MNRCLAPSRRRVSTVAALLGAALLVAACGGGGSDPASPAPVVGGGGGGGGAALSCDATLFQAGTAVSLPTAADMAPFAGTYAGNEGTFGVTGFVKSATTVTLVVAADGTTTYNGATVTLASLCIVKATAPATNTVFLHFAQGGIDLFADGTMSGNKPGDITIGVEGKKP